MIVGIDNGVSGALAIISEAGMGIVWTPMPTVTARKGREVDVVAVWQWLFDETGQKPTDATYIIEEPGGSKSVKAAVSMAASFHALRGMLAVKRCRMERVTPQRWQRDMIPGRKAGESKARAYEAARRLWPGESWLASSKCRTPHDGAIDAALIAEWYRRNMKGERHE